MLYELLSITNIFFVNSEPDFNEVDQKISIELNTNNYSRSDLNTSDSSSNNGDDTNEVLDKEKELVTTRKSSGHYVKEGTCF